MMSEDMPLSDNAEPFIVYHLSEKWDGGTLASALKELASEHRTLPISWGLVKKWIVGRHVEVNGNLCLNEARRVRTGDVLKLWRHSRPKPVQSADLRLAYVDDHLCVVEKPSGVTSTRHSREDGLSQIRRQLQPTLDELVSQALSRNPGHSTASGRGRSEASPSHHRRKNLREKSVRKAQQQSAGLPVFAVHRLDHHTSGLMVLARTRSAEHKLISMFRRHQVRREYVGVCHGQIEPQTIRSYLVRDRGDGLRGSLPIQPTELQLKSAQEAITHVVGAKAVGKGSYSLFRCRLETGRTHQIRIHLSELGHRLCGEPVYVFDSAGNRLVDQSLAPRQALHSDRLAFNHPITSEPLQFEMPWPKDLASWIQSLLE